MRSIGVMVCALAVLWGGCGVDAQSTSRTCEVRLRIDAGWLCGKVRYTEDDQPYASFRGVPYAKPPLGVLRFKELEPPLPWGHLYDATEDSAACPQKDFIYNRIPLQVKGMNEDCIYLNLHTPLAALPTTEGPHKVRRTGVPIIVFVHGGGFQAGSGLTDMHGPEYFMRSEVIIITFNMRINVFGYLSLNTAKVPGNQGLRDIVTVLRWVRRNALAFGGDPENVTMVGHSTGATLAHLVALSEPAKGLFHKLIIMSGNGIPSYFSVSQVHARSVAEKYLAALGINSTDLDDVHDRLTKEPIVNIMYALNMIQLDSDIVCLNLVPVVETKFPNVTTILDEEPLALIAKGRAAEVPTIIGITDAEFNFFKWQILSTNIVQRIKQNPTLLLSTRLREKFPAEISKHFANEAMKYYFNGEPTIDEIIECYSDMYFVHPQLVLAEWRSRSGAPVYLYQFSYEGERSIIKEATWASYRGVAHVEDLTYVFRVKTILQDYLSYPPKNNDDLMREWFTRLLVNFARCSNPTCTKNGSEWPPLSPGHLQFQDIVDPMIYAMKNLTDRQTDMMRFYYTIDEETRNVSDQIKISN